MKLGFVSAILADQTLEQALTFARIERFQCVELMCWPPGKADRKFAGVTHLDVTKFGTTEAEAAREMAFQHGVQFSGLGYYPNPLHPDAAVAKAATIHLKKVILAAETLDVPLVNTFIGRDWTKSVDENWPRFLKIWKPLIAFAADHGVRVAIENCAMLFTRDEWPGGKNLASSPVIWRRMFADLPSDSFGLNYDPSHLAWMRMDWLKPLREFRGKLFHVHAKDVRLDQARLDDCGILAHPLEYHQPRIPGFGEIDWGRFIGTLMEVGYDGPVCVEVEDDTFGKTLEGRQRALRVSRNVLAPFFDLQVNL
jgi:sugar phosphate isomerase/epimerase